jgi:hypothetical protein
MARRTSVATEADIARCIRACTKSGLPIARVVVRRDRVEIEAGIGDETKILKVDSDREVIL